MLTEPAVMFQMWSSLTFLHWAYNPDQIRPLIPAGLLLDLFDGLAWVDLTPFLVQGLRPAMLPPVPNVRTSVRVRGGKPGVWFFSLEGSRLAAVLGARLLLGLPYRWARMQVEVDRAAGIVRYTCCRGTRASANAGSAVRVSDRHAFFTERYRLCAEPRGQLFFEDIEHESWPLQSAELLALDQNLIESLDLPSAHSHPLVHYSACVSVRFGALHGLGLAV